MSDLFLDGKRLKLDPRRAIGKGGEADVYDLGDGRAAKIFKTPEHADYAGHAEEQSAAQARLDEHQHKLPAFPRGLPARVVAPLSLIAEKQGRIRGYAMPLVRDAEPLLRYVAPRAQSFATFRALQDTVRALHARGVTVGDFNDLNVLVRAAEPFLIDADSMQFGAFACRVFTERFLDPLIAAHGLPVAPFTPASDWYAFAALLFERLLGIGPYGGVYKPRDPLRRVAQRERPAQRITVFHPEVVLPKAAQPFASLSDDLLQAFHDVFHGAARAPFAPALLEARFRTCASCGLEHARAACPKCAPHASAPMQTVARVHGALVATTLFRGRVLYACADGWVWLDGATLRREDGSVVGNLSRDKLRIAGRRTFVLRGGVLSIFPERARVPCEDFEVVRGRLVWTHAGELLREGRFGPERIGDVLPGRTRLWAGFGFYEAGEIFVAFRFDPEKRGLDDSLKLPRAPGQRIEAHALVDGERVWFLEARREQGRTVHRCVIPGVASAVAEEGDGSWLGTLGGKLAVNGMLFAPTDGGLVRVEVRGGTLVQTREFPDTAPYVDASVQLFAGPRGLCVAARNRIVSLQLTEGGKP